MEKVLQFLDSYIVYIFPIALVSYIILFFIRYWKAQLPEKGTLEWIPMHSQGSKPFILKRYPFEKKDIAPLIIITLVYAVIQFIYLGDTKAPQSPLIFNSEKSSITLELSEPTNIAEMFYFPGLGWSEKKVKDSAGEEKKVDGYTLEFSEDGVSWRKQTYMTHSYSNTFRWVNAELEKESLPTKYIRITPLQLPMQLLELRLFKSVDGGKAIIDPQTMKYTTTPLSVSDMLPVNPEVLGLFDEAALVPVRRSIMNSTIFDEIYHAYTAKQFIDGAEPRSRWGVRVPYETTHPPLGKLITAVGIDMFGMTPFGYRFFPALFGILMLPFFYLLVKNMFGKTIVAVCTTLIFAFDFMHFVQTRISTIDVYAVFFVILMYLFMFRYITSGYEARFKDTAFSLAMTGLSFGLGFATKWNCAYAGFGLLAMYVLYLVLRAKHTAALKEDKKPHYAFGMFLFKTLLLSLITFIIVPGIIYVITYIPYVTGNGSELTFSSLWKEFYGNQGSMYNYHAKSVVGSTHSFSSRWYQWLFDIRPVYYYSSGFDNMMSTNSTFTSPLVAWAGLLAMLSCVGMFFYRKAHIALFIFVGFLSQLVPWFAISRITFSYHYFPSVIFLCLAIGFVFDTFLERGEAHGRSAEFKKHIIIFTAIAMLLFIMFWPVLSGYPVIEWYPKHILRWFETWPIY